MSVLNLAVVSASEGTTDFLQRRWVDMAPSSNETQLRQTTVV